MRRFRLVTQCTLVVCVCVRQQEYKSAHTLSEELIQSTEMYTNARISTFSNKFFLSQSLISFCFYYETKMLKPLKPIDLSFN